MTNVLKTLLGVVTDACGVAPDFAQTSKVGRRAVTYTFYRSLDDGAVASYRLQLRFFAPTLAECAEMEAATTGALATAGDSTLEGLSIQANGGGAMLDTETNTPQLITYYDITARS